MSKALTPATNCKRAAGKFIVWREMKQRPQVNLNGTLTGYENVELFRYGRVLRKEKFVLVTELFDRVIDSDAWFVEEIPEWPKYEWGSTKYLTRDELNALCN